MITNNYQVGNYVNSKFGIIKIAAVHKNKIGYHAREDKLSWIRLPLVQPIPLSKELIALNFAKDTYTTNMFGNEKKIYYKVPTSFNWDFVWIEGKKAFFVENDPVIRMHYLHELQNVMSIINPAIQIVEITN